MDFACDDYFHRWVGAEKAAEEVGGLWGDFFLHVPQFVDEDGEEFFFLFGLGLEEVGTQGHGAAFEVFDGVKAAFLQARHQEGDPLLELVFEVAEG